MKKLWQTLLIVVILALLIRSCHAQQLRLKVQTKECSNGFCRQVTGYGGCVYIGNAPNGNWIYATAAHNVRKAENIRVQIDDEWKIASVVIADQRSDAALIVSYPGKGKLKCHHFGDDTKAGEVILLRGLLRGVSKRNIKGESLAADRLKMSTPVIQGDSGCPLFRKNGELVGIQSAKDSSNTAYIVPASIYRAIISKRWGKLTCLRRQRPVIVCQDCGQRCFRQKFAAMQSEIASLKQQIAIISESRPQVDLSEIEKRLMALEPLLNRRLQLLNARGEVTADRTYKPGDVMKIRGVYRSK